MSDTQSKRTLTEISHLFLSSVRDRQTGGAPRPTRRPPQAMDVSIDLTPEEFAEVFSPQDTEGRAPIAPVTAVLAAHLGADQHQRVRQLAQTLAVSGRRIGLIELDTTRARLCCFEQTAEALSAGPDTGGTAPQPLHSQAMVDAIEELNVDVDQWIVHLVTLRPPQARGILKQVRHWTLLCGCDHDSVVAAYRAFKGLADLPHGQVEMAVFDAPDDNDAERVFNKLTGVCRQFLGCSPSDFVRVVPADDVAEHTILDGQDTSPAGGVHWQVAMGFLSRAAAPAENETVEHLLREGHGPGPASVAEPRQEAFVDTPAKAPSAQPTMQLVGGDGLLAEASDDAPEVLDLPPGADTPHGVLSAVLSHRVRGLVECSIRPPAYPESRLAVDRQRRLILFAVAHRGLSELGLIGRAWQWLIENRNLVAMALPQLNIDASAQPQLRLLVEYSDLQADVLQPMLSREAVTVESYRKLRWGGRTGVLLEAA